MFFSKATLRPGAARRPTYQNLAAHGHPAHRLVWSLFGDHPDRERDFIYRWETASRSSLLYVVSKRRPDDREGLFRVCTKDYDPQLREGQILAFQLRANPVIKKRDSKGKQHVHDVVMNLKHEMRQEGSWIDSTFTEAELARCAGIHWLQRRADPYRREHEIEPYYGFDFNDAHVHIEGRRKHTFRKPRNRRKVIFTTMDFRGRLRVTNPDHFCARSLLDGVGPNKAYGCGLLLVRPV